jgi:hypothetical protein
MLHDALWAVREGGGGTLWLPKGSGQSSNQNAATGIPRKVADERETPKDAAPNGSGDRGPEAFPGIRHGTSRSRSEDMTAGRDRPRPKRLSHVAEHGSRHRRNDASVPKITTSPPLDPLPMNAGHSAKGVPGWHFFIRHANDILKMTDAR